MSISLASVTTEEKLVYALRSQLSTVATVCSVDSVVKGGGAYVFARLGVDWQVRPLRRRLNCSVRDDEFSVPCAFLHPRAMLLDGTNGHRHVYSHCMGYVRAGGVAHHRRRRRCRVRTKWVSREQCTGPAREAAQGLSTGRATRVPRNGEPRGPTHHTAG